MLRHIIDEAIFADGAAFSTFLAALNLTFFLAESCAKLFCLYLQINTSISAAVLMSEQASPSQTKVTEDRPRFVGSIINPKGFSKDGNKIQLWLTKMEKLSLSRNFEIPFLFKI